MADTGRVMPWGGGGDKGGAARPQWVRTQAGPRQWAGDERQRRDPLRVVEDEHSPLSRAPGCGEHDEAFTKKRCGAARFQEVLEVGKAKVRGGHNVVEVLHQFRFREDRQIFERPPFEPSMEGAIEPRSLVR